MNDTRRIEWPPRSGVFADYTPDEERFLGSMIAAAERGEILEPQLVHEVGLVHEMKALLDARMVPGVADSVEAVEPVDFVPAPADSPFRVPARATDLLAAHDPQLSIA